MSGYRREHAASDATEVSRLQMLGEHRGDDLVIRPPTDCGGVSPRRNTGWALKKGADMSRDTMLRYFVGVEYNHIRNRSWSVNDEFP